MRDAVNWQLYRGYELCNLKYCISFAVQAASRSPAMGMRVGSADII